MRCAVNEFPSRSGGARLQSGAQRDAGYADGMYTGFKGTPAERSESRKVSLAEQD